MENKKGRAGYGYPVSGTAIADATYAAPSGSSNRVTQFLPLALD